jgi:hypothetical protein
MVPKSYQNGKIHSTHFEKNAKMKTQKKTSGFSSTWLNA